MHHRVRIWAVRTEASRIRLRSPLARLVRVSVATLRAATSRRACSRVSCKAAKGYLREPMRRFLAPRQVSDKLASMCQQQATPIINSRSRIHLNRKHCSCRTTSTRWSTKSSSTCSPTERMQPQHTTECKIYKYPTCYLKERQRLSSMLMTCY